MILPRPVRFALIAATAVLGLAGAVALVPVQRYVPELERVASAQLGQAVRIGTLRLALLPRPQLRAGELRIGADALQARSVQIVPALHTLFSAARVIERVRVEGLRARSDALAALLPGAGGDTPAGLRVQRVELADAMLVLPHGAIAGIAAQIELDARGRLAQAQLSADDGRLRARATATGAALALALEARDWIVPLGAPLHFERLNAQGTLSGTALALPQIAAQLYGGRLEGAATLDWQRRWRLEGRVQASGVDLGALLALYSPDAPLSGALYLQTRFGASAASAGALAQALRADGRFVVRAGVLRGVDLAGAARLVGRSSANGADTHFDTCRGRLRYAAGALSFGQVEVSSGRLAAQGDVTLGADRALSGKASVALETGVTLLRVPLRIAGTTGAPRIYPTGAALAGAAAGTAVLGPGVGTTLGTRVADAIDSLFGK